MLWDDGGRGADSHQGSAVGRLVDGTAFTCGAGEFGFVADLDRPVTDQRILHVQPECTCGWRGDRIPCGGRIAPLDANDDGTGPWVLPDEDVSMAHDAWSEHVSAVANAVVPPWHTIRWSEQNLALRELTAQQPRAALRLLRKVLAEAEAHTLDALVSARRQGVSWQTLGTDLGLSEAAVQDLHERAAERW